MDRRTVVAELTPQGASPVATLFVRGPAAGAIVDRLFKPIKTGSGVRPKRTDRAFYGWFGETVRDDGLLRLIAPGEAPLIGAPSTRREAGSNPARSSGLVGSIDDGFEISVHGGRANVDAIIKQIVDLGAERVDWSVAAKLAGAHEVDVEIGELLAKAPTLRCVNFLLNQRAGLLAGFLDEMIRSPDAERIDRSLSWAEFGRHLTEPYRVVLLGKPNVGKSSLINALAGYRRAIVSPVAGTTRDALSASSTFEGVPIDWIDGAGVRSTGDSLEAAGVAKIVAEAQRADLIVDVVDLSDPAGSTIELGELISIRTGESQTRDDRESVPSRPGSPIRMLVGNKRDLVVAVPDEIDGRRMELALSAFEVESVARLGEAVANRLTRRRPEPDEPIPLIARHVSLLRELRGRV